MAGRRFWWGTVWLLWLVAVASSGQALVNKAWKTECPKIRIKGTESGPGENRMGVYQMLSEPQLQAALKEQHILANVAEYRKQRPIFRQLTVDKPPANFLYYMTGDRQKYWMLGPVRYYTGPQQYSATSPQS
jgi:hypothetical protein